ncbi:MAG TPA: DNA methyltransferase [Ignavibacteriales bacterium]|nr:DNA methyltransferase [Ignavibacteriales bacterium]
MDYLKFLEKKIKLSEQKGFTVDPKLINPLAKPHQVDTIVWALKAGRCLIAKSFGLGKTFDQIEIARIIIGMYKGTFLFICPLGVKHQFVEEDGKMLGVKIKYVRNTEEFINAGTPFCITNYERVRDGNFDINSLIKDYGLKGVSLDEGSVLRSLGSDTTQQFINTFRDIEYKFVCTATPAPNEYLEIVNYSEFLGVMDRGQALTRFFQRDSQKAGNLTLYPHMEQEFWLWVSSWALFLTSPSDLGYSDEGYSLPEMNVEWHEISVSAETYGEIKEKDGQMKAFADAASSLQEAARIKKATIKDRLEYAKSLMNDTDHYLLWHLLEDERRAIEAEIPDAKTVYGSQDLETRENRILGFTRGEYRILATKAEIAGSGCNFQRHCHNAIFMSIDYKFNDFIQAIHRIHRFLQDKPVNIHIIYTAEERPVADSLKDKWARHNEMMDKMRDIIRTFGLEYRARIEQMKRSFGCTREVVDGEHFTAVNNDCVLEMANIESNSVGLIHTSIPFGNHYEYSASYNDFGHNEDNAFFWQQMDYLIPELHRVLKPGRNAIIHVKDRIRYSTMTGLGSYTIDPFSDECTAAFRKHGFLFIGRITVVTDVVRENNQTYRLGWTEKCKDASKMSCGLPEYLLIFRKQQTDLSKGFADEPIRKSKEDFTRAKWQLLAHSFWRSSGNRMLTAQEVAGLTLDKAMEWFKNWNLNEIYDYELHKELGEKLDEKKKLPSSFMALKPESWTDMLWTDINYMRGLNAEQNKQKAEKHICPLPFDIVERVIDNWSMEGDTVLDPFAGLFTVPYCAVKAGRMGIGIELSRQYFKSGVKYMKMAEEEVSVPTLFDVFSNEIEEVAKKTA